MNRMDEMEKACQAHADSVYRYLFSLCRDPHLAEELTQETFFRAVKSVGRFDHKSSVFTWLCAIAKNAWHDYLRKKGRREANAYLDDLPESALKDDRTPETEYTKQQEITAIFKAISSLEYPCKEIAYMRLLGDLPYAQIGEILGISEVSARVSFHRARQKIATIIRKELQHDQL